MTRAQAVGIRAEGPHSGSRACWRRFCGGRHGSGRLQFHVDGDVGAISAADLGWGPFLRALANSGASSNPEALAEQLGDEDAGVASAQHLQHQADEM